MNNLKKGAKLLWYWCLFVAGISSAFSQNTILTTGGDLSGSSGSVSYSVGQLAYSYFSSTSGVENQGVQQPFEIYWATSIDDEFSNFEATVFPNPTVREVHLSIP